MTVVQIPAALLPHTIIVRPYQGSGPYGDLFGDPVDRRAFVEDRRRLVVSATGAEVISHTTVYTDLDMPVPIGSQVTVWARTPQERTSRVITVSLFAHPSAWSHQEIALS